MPRQVTHMGDTLKKKEEFLGHLAGGNTVVVAAQGIAVSRKTVYEWRDKDPAFRAAWEQALEDGTQALEQEAFRRAVRGVEEPIHYRGRKVDSVRRYSDTLLIFLLKGRRPEIYRDRVEHSGAVLNLADLDPNQFTPEQAEVIHAHLKALRDALAGGPDAHPDGAGVRGQSEAEARRRAAAGILLGGRDDPGMGGRPTERPDGSPPRGGAGGATTH